LKRIFKIIQIFGSNPKQIKIAFTKKLTPDLTQGILAVIRYRIFCVPVCCTKM